MYTIRTCILMILELYYDAALTKTICTHNIHKHTHIELIMPFHINIYLDINRFCIWFYVSQSMTPKYYIILRICSSKCGYLKLF